MTIPTTFVWYPDAEGSFETAPAVKVTKFGDGYELRVSEVVNTQSMNWSLTFTRQATEINQIIAFLRARNATEAFNWTTPMNEVGVYVCRKWSTKRMMGDSMIVTCNFEQVYEF